MKNIVKFKSICLSFSLGYIISFSLILQGCGKNNDIERQDDYAYVNSRLQNDADLLALIQIKNDFTSRLTASKIPMNEIKEAFLTGNDDFIYEALSYSNKEANYMNSVIKTSGFNLVNRYPLIEGEVVKRLNTDCLECTTMENAELGFANLSKITPVNGLIRLKNNGEMSSSDWIKYTICVAACAVTAPSGPGYFLCCAACIASFGPF